MSKKETEVISIEMKKLIDKKVIKVSRPWVTEFISCIFEKKNRRFKSLLKSSE